MPKFDAALRRYPHQELSTIYSGESTSLHSNEHSIFSQASSRRDDETVTSADDPSSQTLTESGTHDASTIEEGGSEVTEERESRTTPTKHRHYCSSCDASVSSEYSSGSPWETGTESSSESGVSEFGSQSKDHESSHYTSRSELSNGCADDDDGLSSVLDSILSGITTQELSRSETGTVKDNPIVIGIDAPGLDSHQLPNKSSCDEQSSLPLEKNIDRFSHIRAVKKHEKKTAVTGAGGLLKYVNYGPGIEVASHARDLSTIGFLTRKDTHEAFEQQVPKVLACTVDSFRDDVSSIGNRSLKDRLRDIHRRYGCSRRAPRAGDEELGHKSATKVEKDNTELASGSIFCGESSELELFFFALITVTLFTLIILIAVLVAQS